MKCLALSILSAFILLFPSTGYSAVPEAVNLEKTPIHHFYAYHFTDYVQSKQKIKLPAHGLSNSQIESIAGDAGWKAFNSYMSLEGAGATILQECLGVTFLNNVNSVCSEIGGVLVVVQLLMDLANKEYDMAGLNFSKGSIYYSLGKWGSKAMKVGAAGAALVEWYINAFADVARRKHDNFYYETLKWYFYNGDGNKSLEEWEKTLVSSDIKTEDDILKLVEAHVETFWISDNMYNAIGDAKQSWGLVGADPAEFRTNKKHFEKYAIGIYVLPYIRPMLRRLAEREMDKAAQKIADEFNKINDELNSIYVIKGIVKGPSNKIKDLQVKIPGFLETHTDSKGRFKFRFTLNSLMKFHMANIANSGITIEVSAPLDKGFKPMVKRGKIRDSHRKTKEIRLLFELPVNAGGLMIVANSFTDPIRWYPVISGTIEMVLSLEKKTASLKVNLTKTLQAEMAKKRGRSTDIETVTRALYINSVWTDKSGTAKRMSIAPTKKMKRSGSSNTVVMVEEINWEKGTARGYYVTKVPWNSTLQKKSMMINWKGAVIEK